MTASIWRAIGSRGGNGGFQMSYWVLKPVAVASPPPANDIDGALLPDLWRPQALA